LPPDTTHTDKDLEKELAPVKVFNDVVRALGVLEDASLPAEELRLLLSQSWLAFKEDPDVCSPLTESGAPFELSLQVDGTHDAVVRYVVDTANRRNTLAGNRDHYFQQALIATRAPVTELQALFDQHLTGAPPDTPARMMHGVGLARGGKRRGSLYFPTNWMSAGELERRMGPQLSAVRRAHVALGLSRAERIEVAGYDFVESTRVRWKTYSWMPAVDGASYSGLVELHPSLFPAGLIYDAFHSAVEPRHRDRSVFLQISGGIDDLQGKLFFFSRQWGWFDGEGLAQLLGFLDQSFDLNFEPILKLRDAAIAHNFSLMLGLIAIGGDQRSPSVTFYFWPR
jgi:hypothetical protein